MTEFGNKNASGQPLFHLRRIGPAATVPGAADVMCFYRVTYMVGRNANRCDFLIDSSSEIQGKSLSRCHARIVRQAGNQHKVYDDSLNGMFVNNIKITESCVLHEGDRVTFGHPSGSRLPAGSRARQPDSEHQFIFEQCMCVRPSSSQNETRRVLMNSVTAAHKRTWENKEKTESSTIDSNNSQSSQSEGQKPAYTATKIPAKVVTCKCTLNNAEVHTVADQVSKNLNDVQGINDQSITSTSKNKQNNDIKNLQEFTIDTTTLTSELESLLKNCEAPVSIQQESSAGENPSGDDKNTVPVVTSVGIVNTFDCFLQKLTDMRDVVKSINTNMHSHAQIAGDREFDPVQIKSPTKDVCIQTNQSGLLQGTTILAQTSVPPTKNNCIQTDQLANGHQSEDDANVCKVESPAADSKVIMIKMQNDLVEDKDDWSKTVASVCKAESPVADSNVMIEMQNDIEEEKDDWSEVVASVCKAESPVADSNVMMIDKQIDLVREEKEVNSKECSIMKQLVQISPITNAIIVPVSDAISSLDKSGQNCDSSIVEHNVDAESCNIGNHEILDKICSKSGTDSRRIMLDNDKNYDIDFSFIKDDSCDSLGNVEKIDKEVVTDESKCHGNTFFSANKSDNREKQSEHSLSTVDNVPIDDEHCFTRLDNDIENNYIVEMNDTVPDEDNKEARDSDIDDQSKDMEDKGKEISLTECSSDITITQENFAEQDSLNENTDGIADKTDIFDGGYEEEHHDKENVKINDDCDAENGHKNVKSVTDADTESKSRIDTENRHDLKDDLECVVISDKQLEICSHKEILTVCTDIHDMKGADVVINSDVQIGLVCLDSVDYGMESSDNEETLGLSLSNDVELDSDVLGEEEETVYESCEDEGSVSEEKKKEPELDSEENNIDSDDKVDVEEKTVNTVVKTCNTSESTSKDVIELQANPEPVGGNNKKTSESITTGNYEIELEKNTERSLIVNDEFQQNSSCYTYNKNDNHKDVNKVDNEICEGDLAISNDTTEDFANEEDDVSDKMESQNIESDCYDEKCRDNTCKRKMTDETESNDRECGSSQSRKRICSGKEYRSSDENIQETLSQSDTTHKRKVAMLSSPISQASYKKIKHHFQKFMNFWSSKKKYKVADKSCDSYFYVQESPGKYQLLDLGGSLHEGDKNKSEVKEMDEMCKTISKKNLDSKESKMGTETEFSKDIELVPLKDTFDDDCNDEMHTPETEPSMNVKETATVHKETIEVESNVDMDDAYQCSVTPEDMNITSNMKQKETEKYVNSYQPNNIVDRNEDQELDLSTDIVEASICNTDEDAGSGDEILPTNLRFMSKNTPEKQFENMDILNRNISAKIMSLHIERSSSNWISESETQSPVIARQGIDTAVELTSNFGKETTDPIMDKNEDQELDQSTNGVEACCNTDEGVDSDDVILHTNCVPMFENTPEKNPENQDTFIQKNPSQINTTLIEKSTTNVISANQTQSPVINWQGRDTSYLGKENDVDNLSCNFSDNEDFSPEIDFTNWDEDDEVEISDKDSDRNETGRGDFICSEDDENSTSILDIVESNCEEEWKVTETDDDPLNNSDDEMCGETERSADEIIEPSERDNEYIDFDFGESLDEVGVSTAEDTVDDGNTDNVDTTDGGCDKLAEEDYDENSGVIEITDNEKVMKLATKRKRNFDEDDFPKKQRQQTATLDTSTIITTPSKDNQVSHFKTPVSALRSKSSTTPSRCCSPNDFSSTQLMGSTQSPNLDGFSMSKVSQLTNQLEVKASDKARSSTYRSKAKDLLAKLRAKKAMKVESEILSSSADNSSQELFAPERIQRPTAARMMLEEVDTHVGRCKEVINKLKEAFECETGLNYSPRVQAWREELSDVEAKLKFPKTVIAVVGDTGAGKSSLMNAVLDHRSVLPTSGMRACTAVVVEVVQNTSSNQFEADIEFLQEKEWLDELNILLKDFTGVDGEVKNRQPDPASEAYVSYCKIRAVYGKIDKFSILSRLNTVTHWLGKVNTIKSTNPEQFRKLVEKYIETQDPGAGGQYWPIVKHVVLKLPNCDVCSSGASLVDLPGVRDSNAARDKIAREYLKNCTAVWVVSSIHRAIDDKTAKELLGENFRRQLLMDGQYGSIAFICTKTDVLMPSEIIRSLKLEDKTLEHEDKVDEMKQCKSEQEVIVCGLRTESKTLKKNVEDMRLEVQELRDSVAELDSLLDSTDINNEETEEYEALKEYKDELNNKQKELETTEQRIRDIVSYETEATQKVLELEQQMNFHRKAIAAICARARNEYSKSEIKRDFKAGLREMKRRAVMLNDDDDDDDEEDEDDEDIGSTADNLRVFCCSSTEYQKMKNLLTDDGPPQVFSTLEDTQIPNLRNYVHEMTSMRRQQSVERLIRSLGRFVFDLQSYTAHGQSVSSGDRLNAKYTIEAQLKKFDQTLEPMLCAMLADITAVFGGSISLKMKEGASTATKEAKTTCEIWGSAINKENKKDRKLGGLHLSTYRAMVRGQGFFSSSTFGPMDFNEALSEPMFRSLTIVWDKAFSGLLWKIMDKIKTNILSKLKEFTSELCLQLESVGVSKERSGHVSAQLHGSASVKLTETVGTLKEVITNNQRDISRIVTPHIQSSLRQLYDTCANESGPGMFKRMKDHMTRGIDNSRITMFDEATEKLMNELVALQIEIMDIIRKVCKTLHQDLRTAFEPLWEANFRILRDAFLKPVILACAEVRSIYDWAHLENTEERIVIPVNQASMSSSMTSVGQVNRASTSSSMTSVGRGNQASTSSLMTSSCWNTFETFSPTKSEKSFGGVDTFSHKDVKVKMEHMNDNHVVMATEVISRVKSEHIKQEKTDNHTASVNVGQPQMNFGVHSVNSVRSDKTTPALKTVESSLYSLLSHNVSLPTSTRRSLQLPAYNYQNTYVNRQSGTQITQNTPVAAQSSFSLPKSSSQTPTLVITAENLTAMPFTGELGSSHLGQTMIRQLPELAGTTPTSLVKGTSLLPQTIFVAKSSSVTSNTNDVGVSATRKENSPKSSSLYQCSSQTTSLSSNLPPLKRTIRNNLCRSQKNSPAQNSSSSPSPSLTIKKEPQDTGYPKIMHPKYLGTIDLTEGDSD